MKVVSIYVALFLLTIESSLVAAKPNALDKIACRSHEGHSPPDPVACENAIAKIPRSNEESPARVHCPLVYTDGNCKLRILPSYRQVRASSRIDWAHLHRAAWSMWNQCYGPAMQSGQNGSPPHTLARLYTRAWDIDEDNENRRDNVVRIEMHYINETPRLAG